jgi:hypothetical protein
VTKKLPNGTFCGGIVPLVLLAMPYALVRYGFDAWRERRRG